MKLARRLDHIEPFYVMECAKAAADLARQPVCDPAQGGKPMIFLNIGEPDFTAPPLVQAAAQAAIAQGSTPRHWACPRYARRSRAGTRAVLA